MTPTIHEGRLEAAVRTLTGRPDAAVVEWGADPADHRVENMTTEALHLIRGSTVDGSEWQVFLKVLHPASASPLWQYIPPRYQPTVLAHLDWRGEPRVYGSQLAGDLPEGLRLPDVYAIHEDEDRIEIWMERVGDQPTWDLDRYGRTARVLGRLGARWPERRIHGELPLGRRDLGFLFRGPVTHVDLPLLSQDDFWREPHIVAVADARLRAGILQLAEVVPRLLDRIEGLPHGLVHGDAAPDNFLEPGTGEVVAIDWSYGCSGALGSDLAQLLVGRVDSGKAAAEEIPAIASTILDAHVDGLSEGGSDAGRAEVEEAWATHLAVRTVFSALNLDHRPDLDDDARHAMLARRAALARFGIELAERVTRRM